MTRQTMKQPQDARYKLILRTHSCRRGVPIHTISCCF